MSKENKKYYSEGSPFMEAEEIVLDILGEVKEDEIQYQTKEWCEEKYMEIAQAADAGGIMWVYYCHVDISEQPVLLKLWQRFRGAYNREELVREVLDNCCFEEIERKPLDWCVRIYNTIIALSLRNFLTEDITVKDAYLFKLTSTLAKRIIDLGGTITKFGHAYV